MIAALKIKNFAIIDDLNIEFNKGMTVLTGETGSGKSIIIDAIGLLFGERASTEMVRHGEKKAIIEGLIYLNNEKVNSYLEENGIECEDDSLVICREISITGKNLCRINGSLTTVSNLKNIGNLLIDIHQQHDTHRLIKPNNYIDILDNIGYEEITSIKEKYQKIYNEYKKLLDEYINMNSRNSDMNAKIEFFKYQLNELNKFNFTIEEYKELNEKYTKMKNFDKIYSTLNDSYFSLKEKNILDTIFNASELMNKISDIDIEYKSLSTELESSYYQLEEIINTLNYQIDNLGYDPSDIDIVQERMSEYSSALRKYKMSLEELIEYRQKIELEINNFENYDQLLINKEKELTNIYNDLQVSANDLTNTRKEVGTMLEENLKNEFKNLKLQNTVISFNFKENFYSNDFTDDSRFSNKGQDILDILISTNIGEPLKPLTKTASGGELSRIMLGLKTLSTKFFNLSTVIFDEIDAGTSGNVASSIAKKMKSIANDTQVLCITHLPQVAALAHNHYNISKKDDNGRTITVIKELNYDQKIEELAKMLSGEEVSQIAINHAQHLLENN